MKKKICGIVGYPLTNPRSIPIWKKYIKQNQINSEMRKFEVPKNKLKNFINFIKTDKFFLATAVTMPYKLNLFNHVKIEDKFAKYAQSINLIKKVNNNLFGYNTDIFGANYIISNKIKFYETICIIGLGGSGRAIFNYLKKKYKKKFFIIISNKRLKETNTKIFKKLNKKILKNKMLIINCTPLGSSLKKSLITKTPISYKLMKYIDKKTFIFDIVYNPVKTILNQMCQKYKIQYTNGLLMNTIQAQKALNIVFKKKNYEKK